MVVALLRGSKPENRWYQRFSGRCHLCWPCPHAKLLAVIMRRFARFLRIPEGARREMQRTIEEAEGVTMTELRAKVVAPKIDTPALSIHDQQDREVSAECALEYAAGWRGSKRLTTRGLGHVRILHDAGVIAEVIRFVGVNRR